MIAKYDRSIVPIHAGRVAIPPVDIITFSPSKGAYDHLTAAIAPFDVAEGHEAAGGGIQSFAEKDQAPTDTTSSTPTVRDPITWGRDTAPALGALIPIGTIAAAAPGFGVGVVVLVERGLAALRRRRAAARREPTARDLLVRLPADPVARLVAFDAALRLALAAYTGVKVSELDREAAMAGLAPDLREYVAETTRSVDGARYAGKVPPADLAERVHNVIERLEQKVTA